MSAGGFRDLFEPEVAAAYRAAGWWGDTWTADLKPSEVLQRNFWFCAVEDPSSFDQRARIGTDHILLESDYPHCDSTWLRTQEVIGRDIGHLPAGDVRMITWENAARLYRHLVPPAVQADPNAY